MSGWEESSSEDEGRGRQRRGAKRQRAASWESSSRDSSPCELCDSSDSEQEGNPDSRDEESADSEIDGFGDQGRCDADDVDADSPPDAIGQFIEFAKGLLLLRVINARQFCVMMYYLGEGGIERLKKYGLKPTSNSGHFTRKFVAQSGYIPREVHIASRPLVVPGGKLVALK